MKRRTFLKAIVTGAGVSAVRSSASGQGPAAAASSGDRVIASDRTTVVETTAGRIRGCRRGAVYEFLGVPYGDSTAGAGRFRPPRQAVPWAGIRNALHYGPICPCFDRLQTSTGDNRSDYDEDAFLLHRGAASRVPGEDCLRANVWTPEINGSRRRPVMVFLHGGGYESGSAHDLLGYDGHNLARDYDVVVVTHNHRLNAFGYLNLTEIGGPDYSASANVGLLDLVAALEWVRDNIARFGGDPGCVTIFGQSGGGGKVGCLMAMPSADGLFHRAIIQSGPMLRALTPDYSAKLAWTTLRALGLGKRDLGRLGTLEPARLATAAQQAREALDVPWRSPLRPGPFDVTGWGPTVEGKILPRHPFEPDAPSISAGVPLLTGTDLHEIISGVDQPIDAPDGVRMTEAELYRRVRDPAAYGPRADGIIAAFRRSYPQASPFDLYATIAAAPLRRVAIDQALRKSALRAAPAFVYVFSWRTPVLDDRPGSFHACEISFAFNNAELCNHYSAGDPSGLDLSKRMSGAWVAFARSGDPNHPGLPHWPAYTPERRSTLIFDAPCEVRDNPEGEGLDLIASRSG